MTVSHDDVSLMDARYAFETDDGAIIEMTKQGYRHGPEAVMKSLAAGATVEPDTSYMRSSIRLETSHPAYAFVNRMVFIGTGAKTPPASR